MTGLPDGLDGLAAIVWQAANSRRGVTRAHMLTAALSSRPASRADIDETCQALEARGLLVSARRGNRRYYNAKEPELWCGRK